MREQAFGLTTGTSDMAGSLSTNPSFLNPAQVVGGQTSEERLNVSREEFFSLLIAELRSQDPLEPMDNQEMLGQLAQLEMLNSQTQMTDGIDQLTESLNFARLNEAAAMLSKVVTGTVQQQRLDESGRPEFDLDGNPIYDDVETDGLVSSVTTQDGEVTLELLSPVIGEDGQPATDGEGNIITRPIMMPMSNIIGIRDPYINPEAVAPDEVGGDS